MAPRAEGVNVLSLALGHSPQDSRTRIGIMTIVLPAH